MRSALCRTPALLLFAALLTLCPTGGILAAGDRTMRVAETAPLAFTDIGVVLSHVEGWGDQATWNDGIGASVADPKGGTNVSRVRVVAPGGSSFDLTPALGPDCWAVDGNAVHVTWWNEGFLAPLPLGEYHFTAWNLDEVSVSVSSHPTTRYPDAVPAVSSPLDGSALTDTMPTFSWEPAGDPFWSSSPGSYMVEIYGEPEEQNAEQRVWREGITDFYQHSARYNENGSAGIPELTPGRTYAASVFEYHGYCVDPGGPDRPAEYYSEHVSRGLRFTVASASSTSFETERYPWAAFAAGPGQAQVRREVFAPIGAHSGAHSMVADVTGQALAGLRLDLPATPTAPAGDSVRSWVFVDDRTPGDASTFVGFSFSDAYPNSAAGWSQSVGWEALSPTESRLQLGGSSVSLPVGLAGAGWHLVRVNYHRADNSLRVWLDGVMVADDLAVGAGGEAPRWALLGAAGSGPGARQKVRFDDASLTPMWDAAWPSGAHLFSRVEGPEQTASGQTYAYTLRYGNAYPVLGAEPVTETLSQLMYVGLTVPSGCALAGADPEPSRMEGHTAVWELPTPIWGQAGLICLNLATPSGLAVATDDRLWAWVTSDPAASSADPPAPPNWTSPPDAVWGPPQDLLPQHIIPQAQLFPDVWVRKDGPRYCSPGDTLNYVITVGNRGAATAHDIIVRDDLPAELGGASLIVGNIGELPPNATWQGLVSAPVPWGLAQGTVLSDRGYVAPVAGDEHPGNDSATRTTTVLAAHDPNRISVSPEGGADRGDLLTYTLECENEGLGTAYGVYASAPLDSKLDAATLALPPGMSYEPASRTLTWEVGTLPAGQGASTSFTVEVASDARRARPVIGHATVYFPSVPEETPTNVVATVVTGSFPDLPWDHWALLPIELAHEYGVVGGYPDGNYWPLTTVTRDQMATFIARTMAGGDAHVPSGPSVATFPDVQPTGPEAWAYKYVEYAVAHQVVGGYPDGSYWPLVPVDRGQMAVFVARALCGSDSAVPTPSGPPTFPDVTDTSPAAWCRKHVEYIVGRGVVGGYPDGYYHPEITVDRGQMAVFIARAFEFPA